MTAPPPTNHTDGTLSAVLLDHTPLGRVGHLLHMVCPQPLPPDISSGRFWLARCTEDTLAARQGNWSIYTRRALFIASLATPHPAAPRGHPQLHLWLPGPSTSVDPGYDWLRNRPANSALNLIGPLGQGYRPAQATRALLLLATEITLPLLIPALHHCLDQGGRVTLLLLAAPAIAQSLLPLLPIQVEVHRAADLAAAQAELPGLLRWADELAAALPSVAYPTLAHHLRTSRFRLEPGFAHVFATGDLVCGIGACLACVIPAADGSLTRACIHGPFFPLDHLIR